ncbi:hypothetical protein NGH32_07255 [Staphylococcus xylosus]|jgi:predicted transcriptional regulator|uniref:hypothetical protein n=1 Tax=Staphylococcus xylosus TaxID=1288 RepID=UPI002DBFC6C5|nr:hypothetical protein [Staphylococcus xylosus]MEB6240590.1 hypothetical protein [Staphylococcus xylosus]MEB8150498.1 hypothetical protein [Staphylococcus xylosus]
MALQRVKDKHGEVCFVLKFGTETHLIPIEDYQLAKELGMAHTTIRKHLVNGTKSFKEYIEKYERAKGTRRLAIEDREREERRLARIEAKQRKEQERLQMIEDAKCRSKWFEHLAENDIFPKVVK